MDNHQCEHCEDLTDLHITLTGDKISQGAAEGCKSCTLLRTALEKFSDVTDVGEVHALVDCALYLFPFTKTSKKSICTIEIFVEKGMNMPHQSRVLLSLPRHQPPNAKYRKTISMA